MLGLRGMPHAKPWRRRRRVIDFHVENAARLMASLGGEGYARAGDDLRPVLDATKRPLRTRPRRTR